MGDQPYLVRVTDGMHKFLRKDDLYRDRDEFRPCRMDLVEIEAARNEHEPFQVVVGALDRELQDVEIEVGAFIGEKGGCLDPSVISVFLEHYVEVPAYGVAYPDALPSFRPFSLRPGEVQPVWIDVRIGRNVEPDVYEGRATVRPRGMPAQEATVRLTVHRFVLPDRAPMRTAFGFNAGHLTRFYGVAPGTPEFEALHDRYYWFLIEHGLSPYHLPVPSDPQRMRWYLDDPRVSSVLIPYADDPEHLRRTIQLYKEHGWLPKGLLYPMDEPYGRKDYERLRSAADLIHAVEPEAKVICPYYKAPEFAPGTTAVDYLTGAVDIWCPLTAHFHIHEEQLDLRRRAGDQVWWYVCCIPIEPYPNFQIQMPSLDHRIIFWLMAFYDIHGLLYWCANEWGTSGGPYKELPGTWLDSRQRMVYGDGLLVYPGEDGPVSSVRLAVIREGLEDMHYFNLLKGAMGQEGVERFLRSAVGGPTFYERDPSRFMGIRRAISRQLDLVS